MAEDQAGRMKRITLGDYVSTYLLVGPRIYGTAYYVLFLGRGA